MTRFLVIGLASVFFVCAHAESLAVTPKKTVALFNGKSLDGWYTYMRENKYKDPSNVFSIRDGVMRISGEEWGGIATRNTYRDYHLIVEWKWGGATWAPRKEQARDSGILVHGVGEDGAHTDCWLESIESQIIEGGSGDFIMVSGKGKPSLTVDSREEGGQFYWKSGGVPKTLDQGRFNWYGRDPKWKDQIGFRGKQDVEKRVGEWNRQEVICDGDQLTNILNGKLVNKGYKSSHTEGKIQIQSEGAEILIRRVELRPVKKN